MAYGAAPVAATARQRGPSGPRAARLASLALALALALCALRLGPSTANLRVTLLLLLSLSSLSRPPTLSHPR